MKRQFNEFFRKFVNTFKPLIRYLNLFIFILAIIILSTYYFRNADQINFYLKTLRLNYLIISILTIFLGQILAASIWHTIINKLISNLPLLTNVKYHIYSLLGSILPGSVWTTASRVANYSLNENEDVNVIIATSIEAIMISFGSLILFIFTFLFSKKSSLLNVNPLIFALICLLLLVFSNPKVINFLVQKLIKLRYKGKDKYSLKLRYSIIFFWIIGEFSVAFLGALGIIFLLSSFFNLTQESYLIIISAWSLTNTIGNILIWLPGTSLIRDSIFFTILTSFLTLSQSLFFTIIQRVWLSLIIIFSSFFIWLFLDVPGKFNKKIEPN